MAKINNSDLISSLQKTQLNSDLIDFKVGDTISVFEKIVEGKKTRIQKFIGIVLKIRGINNNKTFIVRKESYGVGVEKTFNLHSPQIDKIQVIKHNKVRRAYISYIRHKASKLIKFS